jgi:hypothetical protein
MNKLAVLKFVANGSFDKGFALVLEISEDGKRPFFQTVGQLPPFPEIAHYYAYWQKSYHSIGTQICQDTSPDYRIHSPSNQVTNVSTASTLYSECEDTAQLLVCSLNRWLCSETCRPIREGFLENLQQTDEIRVILETENDQIRRLPWHLWDVVERYPKAEVALGAPVYERVQRSPILHSSVRVLAILGNSQGIDVQTDEQVLRQLPNADVKFLVEPKRKHLNDQLWDRGWDILFFAGHSSSQTGDRTGHIYLNRTESLSITQLRYALRRAIENGLKIAIFNSCDGLGLARNLADLQIPQIIVMREPVPDLVAQEFLKSFLAAFARGESFYLAMREARLRLQGLEDEFPCATWLPIICQHLGEMPPQWSDWSNPKPSGGTVSQGAMPPGGEIAKRHKPDAIWEEPQRQVANTPSHQRKPSRNAKNLRKTLQRLGDWLQAGYELLTMGLLTSISILQLVVLGSMGGGIGALLGFWLTYWSPLADLLARWLPYLSHHWLPEFSIDLEPAALLFTVVGFFTAVAVTQAQALERQAWIWTPWWLGSAGYLLGWLSWQVNKDPTVSGSLGELGGIAAAFVVLGLGLRKHFLVHILIGAIGTQLTLVYLSKTHLLNLGNFILLLSVPQNFAMTFTGSLLGSSIHFFALLGGILGLWLGISYFLISPFLDRFRYQRSAFPFLTSR